jgi:squalene-hopene/tetraprenyl-beta-curcumene cyclase
MSETAIDLRQALENTTRALLQSRTADGHWAGELSSSALSTATALFALTLYEQSNAAIARNTRDDLRRLVRLGNAWLCQNQNPDGGWGDTLLSKSNISTTALCWAALPMGDFHASHVLKKAELWLTSAAGSLDPEQLSNAIKARYGKDQTFSVPILTMCALAGKLGPGRDGWRFVPQLPFELAACPHQWLSWLRLPVVSYALPALIAIGQVRHASRPTWMLPARWLRGLVRKRTLRVLKEIQPPGGGFLEATPLTSFVVMSLVGSGQTGHPVAANGIDFLIRSLREDGSWPIDTNLSTWVTTLSVNALAAQSEFDGVLPFDDRRKICDWLLGQQYRVEHPYTHAAPGAWAWTDLPGGVPDADDTAGALIALRHLGPHEPRVRDAAEAGVRWLLDLQNSDGGIPTFCRGWTNLPFDRSGSDLTAHALHAWTLWQSSMPEHLKARTTKAIARGCAFLMKHQHADGFWLPLWFGNQFAVDDVNPTYGTARVLTALCAVKKKTLKDPLVEQMIDRGATWLLKSQHPDGGWGGDACTEPSIEETALAVTALAAYRSLAPADDKGALAIARGLEWLRARTEGGRKFPPSPIGFYFAKLWYFERQYPVIFACGAMGGTSRSFVFGQSPV